MTKITMKKMKYCVIIFLLVMGLLLVSTENVKLKLQVEDDSLNVKQNK